MNRKPMFILFTCLLMVACGSGEGDGSSGESSTAGFGAAPGTTDLARLDLSGTPRATPTTVGALESY